MFMPAEHYFVAAIMLRLKVSVWVLIDRTFRPASARSSLWAWLHQHPDYASYFRRFQRISANNKFSFTLIGELDKNWPADRVVFVDVGGGNGQQCVAFKETFPNVTGRVILQDLPAVIAEAKLPEGIEAMKYDFFTPQPIKGMYTIRPPYE